jgi:hypothetical protein
MKELFQAIMDGDIEQVEECIRQGADLNQEFEIDWGWISRSESWLPLDLAVEFKQYKIAKLLVMKGAKLYLIENECKKYITAVIYKCVRDQKYKISEFFIESGYPVDDEFLKLPKNVTRERLLLKYHDRYVPEEKGQFIFDFIKKGDIKAISMITKKELIKSKNIDKYLEFSIKCSKTPITALLLHLKQREFGFKADSYEL